MLLEGERRCGLPLIFKRRLSASFWRAFWKIHRMGKLEDCHSHRQRNAVEPGTNVWFKTHNATGLHDGHPNASLRNFVIVIGIDRHQH